MSSTHAGPTTIARPTVCSIRIVGYAKIVGADDTHTPKLLSWSLSRKSSISIIYVGNAGPAHSTPKQKSRVHKAPASTSHFPLTSNVERQPWTLPSLVRDHVLGIPLLARQILGERRLRVRVQPQRPAFDVIGLHQHVGILDRRVPPQRVAGARELLDHVHVVAVEPARPLDPALVVEADEVDDDRVAFPLSDGVPIPRRVLRLDRVVRPAVDGNDAEDVALPVEEDQLGRRLDDR